MSNPLSAELSARANGACELCGGGNELSTFEVSAAPEGEGAEVALCSVCLAQCDDGAELDPKHWFCLQESVWNETSAVQVLSYRLLQRLKHESWASDLLEQVWLDEPILAWAQTATSSDAPDEVVVNIVRDSNGVVLEAGDNVSLTKGLDVKGTNFIAKRGTIVRRIRLCDVPNHISGRVNGVEIYIKGEFLKKVS